MDSYKEYNRLRKNLLQRARYHNIKILNIPTAKQIAVKGKVSKKYLNMLSKESKRLTKEVKASKTVSRLSVQTLREPHKKANLQRMTQKTKVQSSKTSYNTDFYEDDEYYYDGVAVDYQTWANKTAERHIKTYKDYGSQFIATTTEGRLVDKYSGRDLGSALDADSERLGAYIELYYWSDSERKIVEPETYSSESVSETLMFYSFIQQRVDIAFNDYLTRSHGGRKGASLDGISQIQSALSAMKNEDIAKAVERYNSYSDEIKNYLDDALYYTTPQDDHYRALEIVMDLMLSPVDAATAKEIIANHSEDLIFDEVNDE